MYLLLAWSHVGSPVRSAIIMCYSVVLSLKTLYSTEQIWRLFSDSAAKCMLQHIRLARVASGKKSACTHRASEVGSPVQCMQYGTGRPVLFCSQLSCTSPTTQCRVASLCQSVLLSFLKCGPARHFSISAVPAGWKAG